MSALFFFVPKKDGKLQPVQNYRKLNNETIKDSYPLPLIKTVINKLSKARIFSKGLQDDRPSPVLPEWRDGDVGDCLGNNGRITKERYVHVLQPRSTVLRKVMGGETTDKMAVGGEADSAVSVSLSHRTRVSIS